MEKIATFFNIIVFGYFFLSVIQEDVHVVLRVLDRLFISPLRKKM